MKSNATQPSDRRVHKKSAPTPAALKRQPVNQLLNRPIKMWKTLSDLLVAWATKLYCKGDDVMELTSGKVVKPV